MLRPQRSPLFSFIFIIFIAIFSFPVIAADVGNPETSDSHLTCLPPTLRLPVTECIPSDPPPAAGFHPFYQKYCTALGIPILAAAEVPDAALQHAAHIITHGLQHQPDITQILLQNNLHVGVIGARQVITDLPEYSNLYDLRPGIDWARLRSLSGTLSTPLLAGAEENLLCDPDDRHFGESRFLHELAHTIKDLGLIFIDPTLTRQLDNAFRQVHEDGLWMNTDAGSNVEDYWAEGVQSYFNANLEAHPTDGVHNFVNTRAELQKYDPRLYEIIAGIFESTVAARSPATSTTTALPQATHQLQGTAQAGGLATIQVTVSNATNLLSLLARPELPTGWTITGVTGDGTPQIMGNEILFTSLILPSPLIFQYQVQIPASSAQGSYDLRTSIEYQSTGMVNPATLYATVDPLRITLGATPQTYTVTATAGSNGAISPASRTVNHGATTTFIVTPNTGYSAAVSGCGGTLSGTTYTTGAITSACTVTASFSRDDPGPNSYTVTATAGANGTISPTSRTVNHGATTTFTVTPNADYTATVSGCNGTLTGTTYTTGPITSACTVSASFTFNAPNTHLLTVRMSGTGSGTVTSQPTGINCGTDCSERYNAGTTVMVTATSVKGSTFAGWSGACSGLGSVCSVSMTTAQDLTASFSSQSSYIVTAIAGANGTISPASQTVNHGAKTTFTVTPNTGYTAAVAGCDGTLAGALYTTGSITGTCTVSASFTLNASNTHLLTVRMSGTGSGTVTSQPAGINCGADCSESYNTGTNVMVTATSVKGSTFAGWSGACSGPGSACLINMTAAQSLTATFDMSSSADPATTLITHYYISILGRAPEADGLAFWQGLVADHQAQGVDVKPIFRQMAEFFFNSPEYLGNRTKDTQFTTDLYRTFFQREPDAGGLSFWLNELAIGITRNQVMGGFLYSPEFTDFMESLGF